MTIQPRTLAILTALAAAACSSPDASKEPQVTIDAPSLIGKGHSEVDAAMGTPECHEESKGTGCEYGPYKSAFLVNGKAANLTLPRVDDLGTYGLDLDKPTLSKPGFEKWQTQINGQSAEITRFPDYVYIMTVET